MERDKKTDNTERAFLRFALSIDKYVVKNQKSATFIRTGNSGIPMPEVILNVEAWLEKVKDDFKNGIKGNISSSMGNEL